MISFKCARLRQIKMVFPRLKERLQNSLREDKAFSDTTTRLIPGSSKNIIYARILAKKRGVFCGAFLLRPLFRLLSPRVQILSSIKDGSRVSRDQVVARLKGPATAILGGERTFLNLAAHLSGVATLTRAFVDRLGGTGVVVTETRKTTPLWRDLEKWAVRCGGGTNHRADLHEAILVKDNHFAILKKKNLAASRIYSRGILGKRPGRKPTFVQFEATGRRDVWEAIKARADWILLDNMSADRIKDALILVKAARRGLGSATPRVEVSGGIELRNVRSKAVKGVDRISVGSLTHSAPALDLSMEVY